MKPILKFKLASNDLLERYIKEDAATIAKARDEIKKVNKKLAVSFDKLRKANAELSKLHVQQVKLEEKHPKLINASAKQEQAVKSLSAIVLQDIIDLLNQITSLTSDITDITLSADTLLYRESRYMDRFYMNIKKLKNKKLSYKIASQLNPVKAKIIESAVRLYEVAGITDVIRLPFRKIKTDTAKDVFLLDIEVEALDDIFKKLKEKSIDEIKKNALKELNDLKKIEMDVAVLIPSLKTALSDLRGKLHLLESSASARAEDWINKTEKKLEKTLAQIKRSAENTLQKIAIKKIK